MMDYWMRRFICWWKGHSVKDKGWGVRSCRRCGDRLDVPYPGEG